MFGIRGIKQKKVFTRMQEDILSEWMEYSMLVDGVVGMSSLRRRKGDGHERH